MPDISHAQQRPDISADPDIAPEPGFSERITRRLNSVELLRLPLYRIGVLAAAASISNPIEKI